MSPRRDQRTLTPLLGHKRIPYVADRSLDGLTLVGLPLSSYAWTLYAESLNIKSNLSSSYLGDSLRISHLPVVVVVVVEVVLVVFGPALR